MNIEPVVSSIMALTGVTLGVIGTQVGAARQSRTNTRIALEQIAAQRQLAHQNAAESLELERERHRLERFEEAYSQLMIWCSTLETVVDYLWRACCDSGITEVRHAHAIASEWPFTILREPPEAAGYRHYWSPEVHERLGDFGHTSARFVGMVSMILNARLKGDELDEAATIAAKQEVWISRSDLLQTLTKMREIANNEVFFKINSWGRIS